MCQESLALLIEGDIMSLGLQIFLKVLLYSIIIMIVRGVISKIQKPAKELTSTELGERFIDRKIFSIIYLVVAIGFTIILVFAASLPSNLKGTTKGIVIGCFVLLILFFLLISFLYGRVYVKIGKDEIYWRKMCGKEEKVRYEDITSFTMDGSGNLKLYQGNKCILNFATAEHRVFIMEVLKRHKVGVNMSTNIATITMKMGKGYVIFDAVCVVLFVIFFLMSAYYDVTSGILFFFVCIIGAVFNFLSRKARRIVVENNSIIEKRLLKKTEKIEFKEVAYLSLEEGNNTEVIGVHSKLGTIIKIPKYYQNVEMFEQIVAKRHWSWRPTMKSQP